MEYIVGFSVWLIFGILAAVAAWMTYRGKGTAGILTVAFGVTGSFIGGMLGMSAYVFHDVVPLRIGGLIGALLGAFFFSYLYHFVARKAV